MLTRRQALEIAASLPIAVVAGGKAALADQPAILSYDGAAIGGYDPVAYFTQSAPVKGSAEHALSWKGATWHFANAENKAAFQSNPEAYAPKYGGYCAYAAARNYVAPTKANAWSIYEGRLYLNYNKRVRRLWSQDISGNIANADANWPGPLSQ